jgi:putative addiction module component (TIGR02574 family)
MGNDSYSKRMSIAEVRKLPLREKFQILEAIWDDLSMQLEDMDVSPAVRELLDNRLERIENGAIEVHDWDTVKFSIGQR